MGTPEERLSELKPRSGQEIMLYYDSAARVLCAASRDNALQFTAHIS